MVRTSGLLEEPGPHADAPCNSCDVGPLQEYQGRWWQAGTLTSGVPVKGLECHVGDKHRPRSPGARGQKSWLATPEIFPVHRQDEASDLG